MKAGHYNVSFYADGYIHKTFSVDITDNAVELLDVQLVEGYDPEFVEASGINGVSVFPNPVSDRLYIAGGEMRFAALEIYDMTGRLVMSEDNPMMSVDVSSLEAGQYVVRLSTEDGKIIKSKFLKVQ